MKIIDFIKDFIARKKLIRLHKPWSIRSYDLRRELALFWDTPAHMPENSNKEQYEQLIAVSGMGGFSGSGAVCDFLREFDECTVLGGGHASANETYDPSKNDVHECFFWAEERSVLTLEDCIHSKKVIANRDGALEFSLYVVKNFKSNIWIFDDYYLQLSKKFLFDLLECYWRWSLGEWTGVRNGFVDNKKDFSYKPSKLPKRIEFEDPLQTQIVNAVFKEMSVKEYRTKAKKYFEDWFKHLPSKKFLVLDQLFHIGNFDYELFSDYFGDIKTIFVWKDPRDQYYEHRQTNNNYLPQDPIVYCKRLKVVFNNILTAKHENLMIIRFEEFVTQYDKITKQIIEFLELDSSKHINKFKYFDPKMSIKNIGKYKNYHNQEVIKVIERELGEYCWNK